MVISHNSQLGLRFRDEDVKVKFLRGMFALKENELTIVKKQIEYVEEKISEGNDTRLTDKDLDYLNELAPLSNENLARLNNKITLLVGERNMIDDNDSKYFFICESVYKAAELIHVRENFTSRTLKDIEIGKYTYLIGKNRMIRFVVVLGAIKGFYYDDKNNIIFEWGCLMEDGGYYFLKQYSKEFTTIMQLLTFVELGDIEVKILEGGKKTREKDKEKRTINTSNKTVYVVDSSWNQIIIRTTGFAVRGHFRLQPCGPKLMDRKLIWVDAFEKHGYKRRPSAEIIR